MTTQLLLWLVIIGAFALFRILRYLMKGSTGNARLDSAAKQILELRRAAKSGNQAGQGAKSILPASSGSKSNTVKSPTRHDQLRTRSSSQTHKQNARDVMATPSLVVVRGRAQTAAPNTPVVQRRF